MLIALILYHKSDPGLLKKEWVELLKLLTLLLSLGCGIMGKSQQLQVI